MSFQCLVMVLAPFVVVGRHRVSGVVAVCVWRADDWLAVISRIVGFGWAAVVDAARAGGGEAIHIPVQPFTRPVVDAIECLTWRGGRGEQERPGELGGIRLAHEQI